MNRVVFQVYNEDGSIEVGLDQQVDVELSEPNYVWIVSSPSPRSAVGAHEHDRVAAIIDWLISRLNIPCELKRDAK